MNRIFLGLLGGLGIYEFITLRNQCEGDTISEIVWAATKTRPLVPFLAGVVCGHFFWQKVESAAAQVTPQSLQDALPRAGA